MAEPGPVTTASSLADLSRSEDVRRFFRELAAVPSERVAEEAWRLLTQMSPEVALSLVLRFGGSLLGPRSGLTINAGLPFDLAQARDLFAITADHYAQMDLHRQLLAEAEAAETIRRALPSLLDPESLARAEHVVACGRNPDGTIRIVYHGLDWPEEEVLEAYEAEGGLKAWAMATFEPAPAEEMATPAHPQRWAEGVRRRITAEGAADTWIESGDRYPVVRLRCTWAEGTARDGPSVEFAADLDTGCPWCCVPLEPLCRHLGIGRPTRYARAIGEQEHLGRHWLCWVLRPEAFRFEVATADGWADFRPGRGGILGTMGWDQNHALSQVRPEREALAGRCIWRGEVKLTLESTSADWESAPPVTY